MEFNSTADLVAAYSAGKINNWDRVVFCGQHAEVIGMHHGCDGEDGMMFLALLLTDTGIRM